jgi:DNA repair protein RecO (recombination protein O)
VTVGQHDAGAGDATAPASTVMYVRAARSDEVVGGTVASMPAPRRYTTDAIVLSRFDLGEADRVLTLITPGLGKLKAIAKGIRRPTSRLGGSLEPFAELTVALARGRTFDVVTQVSVGHAWLHLRDSLEGAATAWYLAELADRSLEERHAAEPLYALLRRAYELLDGGMAPGRVARWYEMHLLDELGSRPEVDRCVECDRVLESEERFRWVPPLGGVVCERCPGPPYDRTRLSLEALKLVKAYQRLDIEALAELRLAPAVEREVEVALREFVRNVLEREARSLPFLDEVRHVPVPG